MILNHLRSEWIDITRSITNQCSAWNVAWRRCLSQYRSKEGIMVNTQWVNTCVFINAPTRCQTLYHIWSKDWRRNIHSDWRWFELDPGCESRLSLVEPKVSKTGPVLIRHWGSFVWKKCGSFRSGAFWFGLRKCPPWNPTGFKRVGVNQTKLGKGEKGVESNIEPLVYRFIRCWINGYLSWIYNLWCEDTVEHAVYGTQHLFPHVNHTTNPVIAKFKMFSWRFRLHKKIFERNNSSNPLPKKIKKTQVIQ